MKKINYIILLIFICNDTTFARNIPGISYESNVSSDNKVEINEITAQRISSIKKDRKEELNQIIDDFKKNKLNKKIENCVGIIAYTNWNNFESDISKAIFSDLISELNTNFYTNIKIPSVLTASELITFAKQHKPKEGLFELPKSATEFLQAEIQEVKSQLVDDLKKYIEDKAKTIITQIKAECERKFGEKYNNLRN